ncbi:MAG: transposase [Spirochaetia bacterium]|nr:transposase [Spirochaetia bacterium]MCQ2604293.1 transposase [Spirochaetia bacterium]
MSRRCRVTVDGGMYHIINRVVAGDMLLGTEESKRMFMEVMREARFVKKFRFRVKNITVMDNHVHIMVKMEEGESLSKVMQWIFSVFALRYNRKYGRYGHLWADRFRSIVIAGIMAFERTFEYIGNNPVKAGMVARAEDYGYGISRIMTRWKGLIDL